MKKERLFTNRQLLTLLWPLIIEQMLEILVGMADTVMVSSVGEAAISGVSLVDMINQLIITLFGALATGGAVVTSQHLGAKRPEDAAKSAGQLVGLSAILGVGVAAFCLITRTAQLRLFFGTITDEVMQACLTYFTITALSFPFLALYNAGAAIFRSTGNSAVSMKVSGHRQRYQLLRQRALRVRAENGCRGRRRAHADLPRCRCVHHSGAGRAAGLPAAHHAAICHPL